MSETLYMFLVNTRPDIQFPISKSKGGEGSYTNYFFGSDGKYYKTVSKYKVFYSENDGWDYKWDNEREEVELGPELLLTDLVSLDDFCTYYYEELNAQKLEPPAKEEEWASWLMKNLHKLPFDGMIDAEIEVEMQVDIDYLDNNPEESTTD